MLSIRSLTDDDDDDDDGAASAESSDIAVGEVDGEDDRAVDRVVPWLPEEKSDLDMATIYKSALQQQYRSAMQ